MKTAESRPSRRSRGWTIAVALACVMAAFPAARAAEDWSEIYRSAVANADLEDWPAVEERIQEVLRLKPEPDRNVRLYGMWHTSYMPYYYLGLAQYHQGRKQEALKSLQREEAAGVVQHDPVAYVKMTKLMRSLGAGSPGAAAPSAPAKPAPGKKPAAPAAAHGKDSIFDGLELFFEGDYDKSIASFQEALKASKGDDLTLHLYLGMAYAGKAAEDTKQETIWKNMAILEFQRVHQLDPGYTLSSGVFSENMVQLFKDANKKP